MSLFCSPFFCSLLPLSLSKQVVSMCHSVPVLRVEEWPIPGESLTDDTVRALIDRVNSSARGGVRFVGSVLQQAGGGGSNGRVPSPRRGYQSPPHTPPCTPPGEGELEDHSPTYSPGEILVLSSLLFPCLVFCSAPRLPLSHDLEGWQRETTSLLSSSVPSP